MEMRTNDQTTSQESQKTAATGRQKREGADLAWSVVPLTLDQVDRGGILFAQGYVNFPTAGAENSLGFWYKETGDGLLPGILTCKRNSRIGP